VPELIHPDDLIRRLRPACEESLGAHRSLLRRIARADRLHVDRRGG